ncbi:MAG: potassium channel family protein [Desulfobacteraceae bacterium]|jgi:voltage-gated potassium channel Kch
MFIFYRRFKKKIESDESSKSLYIAILQFACLILVYSILHSVFEKAGFWGAVYNSLQTVSTVGYGDNPASTTAGKLITAVFGFILGLGLFANTLDKFIAYRSRQRTLKEEGFMPNPDKNGYVILNFPGERNALTYIENIRYLEPEIPICIVDEGIESLPKSVTNLKVDFVRGSLLRKETYINAKLDRAKAVIVFPESENPDCDGMTKSIVDLVTRFVDTARTRVLYLLINYENRWLFDNIPATAILEDNEIHLIVQECQDPNSAGVIQTLIRNTEGAIQKSVLPKKIAGWTWSRFTIKTQEVAEKNNIEVATLALVSGGDINLLPSVDTRIKEGDYINLVVKSGFDWNKFEDMLIAH